MAEPIFMRVRRVLSASAEEAVDAMERAGAGSIMREAIRQVDRAIDEVRVEQESATQRNAQAKKLQETLRARIADLEEKARFALTKSREDLAEAALSGQLDLEARIEQLDLAQKETSDQLVRLDECLSALRARKLQMEKDHRDFEARRRDSALGGSDPGPEQRLQRKVERAQETFDRVKAGSGDDVAADPAGEAKLAEIDALRRSSAVAERLAALRAAVQGG